MSDQNELEALQRDRRVPACSLSRDRGYVGTIPVSRQLSVVLLGLVAELTIVLISNITLEKSMWSGWQVSILL